MNFFMKITFPILLVLGFITLPTQSFVTESSLPSKTTFRNVGIQRSPFLSAYDVSLFQSSSDNDESSSSPVIVESGSTEETANPTSTSVSEPVEESSGVPIDVPSPILLGSSMVLGIASTGTLKNCQSIIALNRRIEHIESSCHLQK